GAMAVTPALSTTYTLTVTGSGGQTATCQATVTVVTPPAPQNIACVLIANPTSITQGGSITLTWRSTHAVSASLSGFNAVATSGTLTISPGSSTTYVLTVN